MIILIGGPIFKLLQWTDPEKADHSFYSETKEKLALYPELKFESEVNFWKSYWPYFIVFSVFLGSVIWLFAVVHGKILKNDMIGITAFLICISLYPAIIGLTKIIYYFRYRRQEKKYHENFIRQVAQSNNYEEFMTEFYGDK